MCSRSVLALPLPLPGSGTQQGGQGLYKTRQQGIVWVWHRVGADNIYSGLSVRDAGASQDLCVVRFNGIRGATRTRGRRNLTTTVLLLYYLLPPALV